MPDTAGEVTLAILVRSTVPPFTPVFGAGLFLSFSMFFRVEIARQKDLSYVD